MAGVDALHRGREAVMRHRWTDAYAWLGMADEAGLLAPADVDQLAMSACMLGHEAEAAELWERAHRASLQAGDRTLAARCGFWLGLRLLLRGEEGRGGGWLARARRLLGSDDVVEQGYLLIPQGLQQMGGGDPPGACATFGHAARLGDRFADPDLRALARMGLGQALVLSGDTAGGVALLDEVMVEVTAGEVSGIVAGLAYCAGIDACHDAFDLRRAREWTAALTRWCDEQPDVVAYRGQCLVHRAEVLQMHGAWPDALVEARQAAEQLRQPPSQPGTGDAYYLEAELHRLRGEFPDAEHDYERAGAWGRQPQPGLALLRLAQHRLDAADGAIRRLIAAEQDRRTRAHVLAAGVEILLATGDAPAARTAADELAHLAADVGGPFLAAAAAHASGAVLLAEGDAQAALGALTRACTTWAAVDVPYQAARSRVLLAQACRELGDADTAAVELAAARSVLERLGARPDLDRLPATPRPRAAGGCAGLTDREVEVLRLLATGRTNQEIAETLVISQHTVRRHLQNVFAKVGVSSRSAATAFAFQHDLV